MATYELWLSRPDGRRLAMIPHWVKLRYRRRANDVGVLGLVVPAGALPLSYYAVASRLEVWRDGVLDTETVWLIQSVARRLTLDKERLVEIGAVCANHLLARRIVAYAASSPQATKTAVAADNIMKAIVRENLGSLATVAARSIASYLSVEVDRAEGPLLSKRFSYRHVLTVLQEIAEDAGESGTMIYFDVVAPTPSSLEFRTYKHQRGLDHSFGGAHGLITVSPEAGTLIDVRRGYDYSQEVTYVLAAGQGLQSNRAWGEASSAARAGRSPFGRRERFRDARHVVSTSLLQSEARASLRAGQPRRIFDGIIQSNSGFRYGREWRFGDKVNAQFEGEVVACFLDTVEVEVDQDGGERAIALIGNKTDD
ncbi:MAG TPA: hypothetical protein VER55_06170 [Ardenticatenaceae bacterium]|nr:hypothetical protein [Ardenticatenaceae bacterium]